MNTKDIKYPLFNIDLGYLRLWVLSSFKEKITVEKRVKGFSSSHASATLDTS